MRKVLIITYYWPPAGGSGVQRWLKFSKYLRDFGWDPIVYIPLNPEVFAVDDSLQKDIPKDLTVIRRKIFEPYRLFRFITRQKANMGVGFTSPEKVSNSWLSRLSVWIRGNLLIPDPRIFWVKPSIQFLTKYIKTINVDAIITTGPPHSMHLIGMGLKSKTNVKWVADFRDPWTKIDFFELLKLSQCSRKKHERLEKKVVESADSVIVVSPHMKNDFQSFRLSGIEVITNGYDHDDFPENHQSLDNLFTITHAGSIPPNRNCPNLWKVLKSMVDADQRFASELRIHLVGSVDASVVADIESNGLGNHCKYFGYLPHSEGVRIMQQSQILLLLVNNSPNAAGILTGKVFEYMAAQRPILAIAPKEGDLDNLLSETKTGVVAPHDNPRGIENALKGLWQQYQLSFPDYSPKEYDRYSREKLTEQLANLLNILTK